MGELWHAAVIDAIQCLHAQRGMRLPTGLFVTTTAGAVAKRVAQATGRSCCSSQLTLALATLVQRGVLVPVHDVRAYGKVTYSLTVRSGTCRRLRGFSGAALLGHSRCPMRASGCRHALPAALGDGFGRARAAAAVGRGGGARGQACRLYG